MFGKIFGIQLNRSSSPGHPSNSVLRLGDRVQAANGDQGFVRGFHPDGKIIISLEQGRKSKAVFSSFLKKMVF